MPDECKAYRFVKEETVEGKRAYVVSGQADLNWSLSLMPVKDVTFLRRDITLWIDEKRFYLLKASCNIIYRVALPTKPGQKSSVVISNISFTESHRDITLNIPIHEEDFFFQAPRGAVEKYQERK